VLPSSNNANLFGADVVLAPPAQCAAQGGPLACANAAANVLVGGAGYALVGYAAALNMEGA
jgi:hypothetical protein